MVGGAGRVGAVRGSDGVSRLADQIRTHGLVCEVEPPHVQRIKRDLADCIVLSCDNIADYYFDTAGRLPTAWDIDDFPTPMPAWPVVFCEFRVKRSWKKQAWWLDTVTHGAVLLRTYDADCGLQSTGTFRRDGFQRVMPEAVRWYVEAILIAGYSNGAARALQTSMWWLDAKGHVVPDRENANLAAIVLSEKFTQRDTVPSGMDDDSWQALMDMDHRSFLYPAMLALSFMHCKNVSRELVEPPPKLSRAHEKRHGAPLVKYYTLQIDPMREILKREGGSEQHGLPKALHICRGHFAHYDDKPLFGKVTGTFWRPMHTRGRAKDRIVIKDYAITPGKTE